MTHLDDAECVVYELWMISVLQDTFPCTYPGLYGLALPCIYSMCKNCRPVCIYNNTASSHCVRALHECLHSASMWLAIDLYVGQ